MCATDPIMEDAMKVRALAPAVALLAVAAPNASAATTQCDAAPTAPLFGAWGDQNEYTPFKGATFENGASGWSWGGKANIVNGDSGQLLTPAGSHAVNLPGGGLAKSPWTCVDSTMPSMRFMVRRVSGTGNITVKGVLAGAKGSLTTIATFAATDTWQPSPPVVFPPVLLGLSGSLDAQFQFIADPGTTFRIDDILMDPFKVR
jgi:hypothetical protein